MLDFLVNPVSVRSGTGTGSSEIGSVDPVLSNSQSYCLQKRNINLNEMQLYQWDYMWKGQNPTKVKCFTWLVVKRVGLTQNVLQKKGKVRHVKKRCTDAFNKEV